MGNDEIKEILRKTDIDAVSFGVVVHYITTLEQAVNDTKDSADDMLYELKEELEEEKRIEEADLHKIQTLEEENERLKKALNCKEYFSSTMPEDTEFVILTKNNYDRQQKDIQFELIDYKSRCEKAIEYIEEIWKSVEGGNIYVITIGGLIRTDLLNILQNGGDKNE